VSWNDGEPISQTSNLAVQLGFEGDASMVRPRLHLTNTSPAIVHGLKARYYFRGEAPSQVVFSKFYTQEGTASVHQEGANLAYAEWSFPDMATLPGESPLWGQGPHFGLNNADWTPWNREDDPSFAADGVVLLDGENRWLAGSCFEDESPVSTVPAVAASVRDARNGDGMASHLYVTVENVGKVPVKN
jgi:hypothetical protein